MSRRLITSSAAFLGVVISLGQAQSRPAISPTLRVLDQGENPPGHVVIREIPGVGPAVDVFLQGDVSDAELKDLGVILGTRLPGGLLTAKVPLDRFQAVTRLPGLRRLSGAGRMKLHNDVSIPNTKASPNFWTSAPPNFTGQAGANVIVGIVDTGIDWTHQDFKNPNGTTRILAIWDQNDLVGPNPPGFAYGTHWTSADINAGIPRHDDLVGHGTHVSGIAAGDGSGTGNGQAADRFIGVAPRADIIFVATDFSETGVVDAVNFVFQRAAALGKQAVVNLSLGTQFGAHDGTDNLDQMIDALTGPGKIVVASAGNDGNQSVHAEQFVPPAGGPQTITFNVPAYTASPGASNDFVVIDAYYQGADNMTVTLRSPGPGAVTVGPVSKGMTGANAGSAAGNIYVENGFTPSNSGDANVFIQIYDSNSMAPPRSGVWTMTLTPVITTAATQCDLWLANFSVGTAVVTFTSDTDESELVGSPGVAGQVIAVAAFTSKTSWPSIDGNNYSFTGFTPLGSLTSFSSPGPNRNGAQKPDIAAPGSAIVSTLSSAIVPSMPLVNPDGVHWTQQGTSMSSPHVAGSVALHLADLPNQTPAQLKARLAADALVDGNTGAVPNAQWGSGKLRLVRPDLTAPTITLNAPNGGENWIEATMQQITWNASDNVGVTTIDLEYSTNNGSSWNTIATGEANDGTYDWTIPAVSTAQALVRATARDAALNAGQDQSDAVFNIQLVTAAPELPLHLARPILFQNTPNPFNPTTVIGFALPEATPVRIRVYSSGGQVLRHLVSGTFPKGYSEVTWDGLTDRGHPVGSGVYFYGFEAAGVTEVRRMVLAQ